jgi:hypothetical protein
MQILAWRVQGLMAHDENSVTRNGAVEVALIAELGCEQISRVFRLFGIAHHQVSSLGHLPVDIAEDAAAILLRKIE